MTTVTGNTPRRERRDNLGKMTTTATVASLTAMDVAAIRVLSGG
jgi:hypothetical protein